MELLEQPTGVEPAAATVGRMGRLATMAGSLGSTFVSKRAKPARKSKRSVAALPVGVSARRLVLGAAAMVILAPLFVVTPFGNAAPVPTMMTIGQAALIPAGTTENGPLASNTSLTLDVVLSPQNPGALASFIDELYDPTSPDYHHFLTTGQFGPETGTLSRSLLK